MVTNKILYPDTMIKSYGIHTDNSFTDIGSKGVHIVAGKLKPQEYKQSKQAIDDNINNHACNTFQ